MEKIITTLILLLSGNLTTAQSIKDKIDSLVSAYASNAEFNGSILVSHKGQVIIAKGYGYMDADQKLPNNEKSIFNIASITKTFTAALVIKLVESGKLRLQDKVSKFDASFPNGEKITMHHLLTHTSGIANYTDDKSFQSSDQSNQVKLETMINYFRNKPLDFEPGTKFKYSNSGYTMLGFIIETVTGKSLADAMSNWIFKPLNMQNTSFGPPFNNANSLATGFQMYYKNYKNVSFKVHPSISYATGAIYSSVEDLYKWHQALQGGFLSPHSMELMYKKDVGPYGYGWFTDSLFGEKRVSHDGNIAGYKSNINRIPDQDICVIALSNSNPSAVGGMVRNIIHILFNKPLSKTFAEQPVISVTDSLLKEFTGKYLTHEKDTTGVQINLHQSALIVRVLNQEPFKIYPIAKNTFKSDDKRIEFRRNSKGEIEFVFIYVRDEFLAAKKLNGNL